MNASSVFNKFLVAQQLFVEGESLYLKIYFIRRIILGTNLEFLKL